MNLADYLIPVVGNTNGQGNFGDTVIKYPGEPDFEIPASTKVAIIGVPEDRFSDEAGEIKSPAAVRRQLYALSSVSQGTVIDLGNLRTGKTLVDTYYGLRDVVAEMFQRNITVLIIGGTVDIFFGNYLAMEGQNVNLTNVAPRLRLPVRGVKIHPLNALAFEVKTGLIPSLHISNIGYQSYYVQQQDLDYFSDQHFEAYRLGELREGNLHSSEPVIRDSDLLAISMDAVKYSDAPAASCASPNGFTGEEACALFRYAGMSGKLRSIGIYGYFAHLDKQNMTAKQISHLIWYLLDGIYQGKYESSLDDRLNFNEFHLAFSDMKTDFLQSKKTNRWWMQLPNEEFIPCSYSDYILATHNEIPERWLRAIERK
jgi:arginase family enzyme